MRPARVPAREARGAQEGAVHGFAVVVRLRDGVRRGEHVEPPEALSTKSHSAGLRSPLASMNSGTSRSSDAVATRSSQK